MSPSRRPPSAIEPSPGEVLRDACCQCVTQCLDVIAALPESAYRHSTGANSSIGVHLRHIVERILCVLDGVVDGQVDYDCRPRDPRLEQEPKLAAQALERIQLRLATLEVHDNPVLRVQESVHQSQAPVIVTSSLDREFMSLVSHTIHHLAIIALLARGRGVELQADIGKAPSTLIHERVTTASTDANT